MSRTMASKRLGVPTVSLNKLNLIVSEVIGGILLGPSVCLLFALTCDLLMP